MPSKPIRQRFDGLRRAAWWDWPVDLVTEHAHQHGRHAGDIEPIATENGLEQTP
jgi:virginiamycin A acetyltransferase